MVYELSKLPYEYNALEPYIDEKTMRIHHQGHHQTYVDKLNKAVEKYPELQKKTPEELVKDMDKMPEDIKTSIRNFGGGVVNHNFFWPLLKKNVEPKGKIIEEINKKFGNMENFKKQFSEAANITLFGSGYAFLVLDKGELSIIITQNQDSPLSKNQTPLLTIDMWEHAYYLKYHNKKTDYSSDFFNVINWDQVNKNYLDALTKSREEKWENTKQ